MGVFPFSRKSRPPEVYQEFIQVDVVDLPDALVKDLAKMDMTQPIVDNPIAEEELAPKPTSPPPDSLTFPDLNKESDLKKQKEAEEKKKLEAKKKKALEKLQEEAKKEAALKSLTQAKGKTGRAKLQGNIQSKGTSTKGTIGDAAQKYGALVRQKIKENFNVFAWQKTKSLSCVVYIRLYSTGRVREKRILKKSSDPLYDSAVLQAIDESQPLPIPEETWLLNEGLSLEFKPEE
jgi:outer membrane biosynthesis protein TonB